MRAEAIFLGTGGGRFVTATQRRRTAGIRILMDGLNAHVDPGPGALVYSIQSGLDPRKLNAVLVSHSHPDHYTDAEVLIEAMAGSATKRRGRLFCSKSVVEGVGDCGPSVSKYHRGLLEEVVAMEPGDRYSFGGFEVIAARAAHTDPSAIGFIICDRRSGVRIGYTSDTEYFEGAGSQYFGVDLLILCTMRPSGEPWAGHMSTDDAIKIILEARPRRAVITHFGLRMLQRGPEAEAKLIERETKVPTLAAKDGMRVAVEARAEEKDKGLARYFE